MTVPQYPTWISIPSPNFHPGRKPGIPISGLIIHFTAAGSGKGTADYFSKKEVSWKDSNGLQKVAKVQAASQLVIDRDGTIFQCTDLNDRAWHAGPSTLWKGKPLSKGQNVNDWTIGFEIANWGQLHKDPKSGAYLNYLNKPYKGPSPFIQRGPGTETFWEPFPEAQVIAVIKAAKVIVNMYPKIVRENVLGHRDVDPSRKVDPGPAWPMERFLDEVFGDDDEHKGLLDAAEDDDRAGHYDEEAEMCLEVPVAHKAPQAATKPEPTAGPSMVSKAVAAVTRKKRTPTKK